MFRFHLPMWTLNAIKHEFEFLLEEHPAEIPEDASEENLVARFNLARLIFLERAL